MNRVFMISWFGIAGVGMACVVIYAVQGKPNQAVLTGFLSGLVIGSAVSLAIDVIGGKQ